MVQVSWEVASQLCPLFSFLIIQSTLFIAIDTFLMLKPDFIQIFILAWALERKVFSHECPARIVLRHRARAHSVNTT